MSMMVAKRTRVRPATEKSVCSSVPKHLIRHAGTPRAVINPAPFPGSHPPTLLLVQMFWAKAQVSTGMHTAPMISLTHRIALCPHVRPKRQHGMPKKQVLSHHLLAEKRVEKRIQPAPLTRSRFAQFHWAFFRLSST
jgi:hypothetical protein